MSLWQENQRVAQKEDWPGHRSVDQNTRGQDGKETAEKLKKKEAEEIIEAAEEAAPEISAEQQLLCEIRDLLKEQASKVD